MFDVVVFGSGLAGLAATRRLSRAGRRVALVEKAKTLGGHLLPFERGGVTFEVGLHYIADVAPGSAFDAACRSLDVAFDYVPLDPRFEELRFEDGREARGAPGRYLYAPDFGSFVRDLQERFPLEARALDRYGRIVGLCWKLSKDLRFPARTGDLLRAVASDSRYLALVPFAPLTLGRALRREFGFPEALAEILEAQHLLMGVPPSRLSCLVHFIVHRYYFEGACFVRGGGREMIRALREGVDASVHASADTRLSRAPDGLFRVRGTSARGDVDLTARRVIWTPDPRALAACSDLALPALTRARLASAEDPHALVVASLATRAPLGDLGLPNRNVWLMGTLSAEECYLERDPEILAARAPVYVSTGSLRDPEACPGGNPLGARGLLQAMFLCPGDARPWDVEDFAGYRVPESKGGQGRAYRVKKERVLGILLDRLERSAPGLRASLAWKELGTPLTHQRYLHSLSRTGYGFAATPRDLLLARPSYESGVEGLHFCGAHVKPAHGIVTALVNGVGLAERILTWDNPPRRSASGTRGMAIDGLPA